MLAQAHHLDYSKPFLVVWVGESCGCHRRLEHGTLRIPKKAVYDYSSLVAGVHRPHTRRSRYDMPGALDALNEALAKKGF